MASIPHLLALAICGLLTCSAWASDRLNHVYSGENAAKAGTALTNFAGVSGQSAGINAKLLSNLDAQLGLIQRGDDVTLKLNENDYPTALIDQTWRGLRTGFYSDVGVQDENQLTNRVQLRVQLVKTIAVVLNTLAEGQAALAQSASKRLAGATAQLTNAAAKVVPGTNPPPSMPGGVSPQPGTPGTGGNILPAPSGGAQGSETPGWLDLFKEFYNDVVEAGRAVQHNATNRASLNELQARILREAEKSRDPASAYALAVGIGGGLREGDLAALNAFLDELRSRLEQRKINSSNAQSLMNAERMATAAIVPGPSAAIGAAFFQSLGAARILVENAPTHDLPRIDARTAASFRTLAASPSFSLGTLATNLPATAAKIVATADALDLHLGKFREALDNTNLIHAFARALQTSSADDAVSLVMEGLKVDPTLAEKLNGKVSLSADQIKYLKSVFQDIKSEQTAAANRLLQFLADLTSAEVGLFRENARHYTALNTIAAKEVRRWEWIVNVNSMVSALYVAAPNDAKAPYLFMNTNAVLNYAANYRAELPGQDPFELTRGFSMNGWTNSAIAPPVLQTDKILPSLRLLAEHARLFQTASPAEKDPLGIYTSLGRERLQKAVKVIDGYLFLRSYSARQGIALSRMLLRETKEHSIHVDGVTLQTMEADLRLQLGDSLAFHSTGITGADLQFIINAVQSGFVGWIGAKQ